MTTVVNPPEGADVPGVTRRHRFADLYHERTNFQFIAHSKRWAIISGTLIVVSLLALFFRGLNLNIDFEGGTVWQVEVSDSVDASVPEVRDLLEPLGFGDAKVSTLSAQGTESVRVQAETITDPVREIQDAIAAAGNVDDTDVLFEQDAAGSGTFTFTIPEGEEMTEESLAGALEAAGQPGAEVAIADRTATVTLAELPASPIQEVAAALAEYGDVEITSVSISTVGPTWGERISRKAIQALIVFFLLLAVYLTIRFEWKMAIAAIVAVLHDIIVVIGFYALFQFTVSPATVTAFLTILGFSLYDTVVVFDKVRENERLLISTGRSTYPEMVNRSLNAVLMRSLSTTLVALLPVISLLVVGAMIMGATALEEFALALLAGLFVGSYSSIYVAAPLLAWWKGREPQYRALADKRRRTAMAAASAATGVPVVDVGSDEVEADEPRRAARPGSEGVPGPPAVGRTVPPRPRTQRGRKRK